jgi:hypothetical protein
MRRPQTVIAGLIGLTCLVGHAEAAPPPDADPTLAPWFNGLRQPWTNAPSARSQIAERSTRG